MNIGKFHSEINKRGGGDFLEKTKITWSGGGESKKSINVEGGFFLRRVDFFLNR